MRAILTYHSIDPSGSPISVDEAVFGRHVAFLASGRVKVVPLEALLALDDSESAVALTFDDGFENFAAAAWPRLAAAGLPATVFIVSGHVGGDNRWGGRREPGIPELPLMNWDAVSRVAQEGAALGSHTMTHPHLPDLDEDSLAEELVESRARIESETGVRPRTFAYPFGSFDPRTTRAVGEQYGCACTTELRPVGPDDAPCLLPRLDAYYLQRTGALEAFGSPAFRRSIARRALLRRVRARLRGGRRPSYGGAARSSPARQGRSI